jgi:hypothetical protein
VSLLFLLPALAFVGALVGLFVWSLRAMRAAPTLSTDAATLLEHAETQHAAHYAQVRQALSIGDFEYLVAVGVRGLAEQVRRERRRIALAYLAALRHDFYRLLHIGGVVAKLSPEVIAMQEFERLRLATQFTLRCRLIELQVRLGMTTSAQIGGVSDRAGQLAVRIEAALKELAERAAAEMPQPSTGAA